MQTFLKRGSRPRSVLRGDRTGVGQASGLSRRGQVLADGRGEQGGADCDDGTDHGGQAQPLREGVTGGVDQPASQLRRQSFAGGPEHRRSEHAQIDQRVGQDSLALEERATDRQAARDDQQRRPSGAVLRDLLEARKGQHGQPKPRSVASADGLSSGHVEARSSLGCP